MSMIHLLLASAILDFGLGNQMSICGPSFDGSSVSSDELTLTSGQEVRIVSPNWANRKYLGECYVCNIRIQHENATGKLFGKIITQLGDCEEDIFLIMDLAQSISPRNQDLVFNCEQKRVRFQSTGNEIQLFFIVSADPRGKGFLVVIKAD